MQLMQRRFLWVGSFFAVMLSLFMGSIIFAPSALAAPTEYYQYIPGPPSSIRVTGGSLVIPGGLFPTDGTNLEFKGNVTIKGADSRVISGVDPSVKYPDCQYTLTLKIDGINDAAAATPVDDTAYVNVEPNGGAFAPAGYGTHVGDCKFGDIPFSVGQESQYVEGQSVGGKVNVHVKPSPFDTGGGTAGSAANPNASGEKVHCTSNGSLDWILCPALDAGIRFSQFVTMQISQYLQVPAVTNTAGGGAIYNVWQNMRNIANGFFVVVMIILIFSQASSIGLSAYGIKKTLPKVIIAAIAVNLSFYICAFGVDVSNVLGNSIASILDGALGGAAGSGANLNIVQTILGSVLGLAALGPILFFAVGSIGVILLGLLIAFLTIAARQALVVVLVLVSPIAFIAWILPNTEKYFNQWSELFITTLIMYPLIMLVFAGAQVAAKVIAGV